MKKLLYKLLFSSLFLYCCSVSHAQKFDKDQQFVIDNIESRVERTNEIAHKIWEFAELGYQEKRSSTLLMEELRSQGFNIEKGIASIPTAFVAEYGSGKPVIGILAEYDALPGISQEAIPERKARTDTNNGHACGHHLFGSGSTSAAIAVRDWLKSTGKKGTIRLYGTPAEEGGAGKVYMVREGLFDDVDAMLHWHPGSSNDASAASSLSNKSAKFRFYGKASHAAGSPWRGRSALDGVEAMNHMINLMREHVPVESRIHYVITSGGEAPNVVPAFAEVFYYTRHPEMEEVKRIFNWVVQAAEGAAMGTDTRMEYEVIHGLYNVLPNVPMAKVMHKNLMLVGGVSYNEEEREFANQILKTYKGDHNAIDAAKIEPFKIIEKGQGGSTDVGDVSWAVPTAGLRAATWVPGTGAHSWQAVAAGGTSIGHKGMIVAAKTMALTAIDLIKDQNLVKEARIELEKRTGTNFNYEPLLGDRKPPLDYRK